MHRLLGVAAVLSGLMTFLALGAGSLLAGPIAVVFTAVAFWWNLTRPGGAELRVAPAEGPCAGCRHGCVECRERIEA